MSRVSVNGLMIDEALHRFILSEALPGTGVEPDRFFSEFARLIHDLAPKNRTLLETRDRMQARSTHGTDETVRPRSWCLHRFSEADRLSLARRAGLHRVDDRRRSRDRQYRRGRSWSCRS